jgi:hypothetical protein
VLGQGADLEERLANNKYGGGLIYTPTPVAACARPHSNTRSFRPAPDVAPVRAQTSVSITMVVPDSPSARARTLYSRPQHRAHEESTPDSTHPHLESMPGPIHPRLKSAPGPIRPRPVAPVYAHSHVFAPKRLRPHSRPPEESTPGPTHPRLESAPDPTRPRPLPRVCTQRGRALTSRRTRPTAQAISACP